MRKDQRVMEVTLFLNKLLKRNPESRQRQLAIRFEIHLQSAPSASARCPNFFFLWGYSLHPQSSEPEVLLNRPCSFPGCFLVQIPLPTCSQVSSPRPFFFFWPWRVLLCVSWNWSSLIFRSYAVTPLDDSRLFALIEWVQNTSTLKNEIFKLLKTEYGLSETAATKFQSEVILLPSPPPIWNSNLLASFEPFPFHTTPAHHQPGLCLQPKSSRLLDPTTTVACPCDIVATIFKTSLCYWLWDRTPQCSPSSLRESQMPLTSTTGEESCSLAIFCEVALLLAPSSTTWDLSPS